MTEKVNKLSEMLQLRASKHFLAKIDDWRRKRSPIPSRSEAIRTLTANGLKK